MIFSGVVSASLILIFLLVRMYTNRTKHTKQVMMKRFRVSIEKFNANGQFEPNLAESGHVHCNENHINHKKRVPIVVPKLGKLNNNNSNNISRRNNAPMDEVNVENIIDVNNIFNK